MSDQLFFIDRHADDFDEEGNIINSQALVTPENPKNITAAPLLPSSSVDNEENDAGSDPVNIAISGELIDQSATKRRALTAVWRDEDDEEEKVNLLQVPRRKKLRQSLGEDGISNADYEKRLRDMAGTRRINRGPGTWAKLPSEKNRERAENDEDGSDDEEDSETEGGDPLSDRVNSLMRSARTTISASRHARSAKDSVGNVQPGVLDIRPVTKANVEDPSNGEARCVDFHPTGRMLLTAGLDKTLRLFHVDGEKNAKLQSIHVHNFPIHSARFTGGGSQIVITGRRRFFHVFDLQSVTMSKVTTLTHMEERSWENMVPSADGERLAFVGQHGRIIIMSNKSKREIGRVRMNGRVADLSFAPSNGNEHELFACSTNGSVYTWDVRNLKSVDVHKDEGAVHDLCIATSPRHYAVGSDSGVVNVYKRDAIGARTGRVAAARTQKPVKSFFNLRTPIHNVSFNGDGSLFAFASHDKPGAVRIGHSGSMTVFSNWPSTRSTVGRVCSVKFSPGGGFLAVGDSRGHVNLMRLMSYPAW